EVVEATLEGSGADEAARRAGFQLAVDAWAFRSFVDPVIERHSPDWPLRRQPMVDRNLLRLACFEIERTATPPKVAINEAIELAKEFGGEKSPGFVNAILDEIAADGNGSEEAEDASA
ncbi:MAG: transcription antitermination factor NusB, partial [Planctomycetota bacterium]|nr:transcription antitermination factor NusB [Planctomycetota bacterium]